MMIEMLVLAFLLILVMVFGENDACMRDPPGLEEDRKRDGKTD